VSVRFGVLIALAFGAVVAYLASQNTSHVRVVAAEWVWEVPLATLVVGAFLAGAVLALVAGLDGCWTDRCPSCRGWNTSRP